MSFLQIPPEKRIQLPWCPDYDRLFQRVEEKLREDVMRPWREVKFRSKREARLRRKAHRRLPRSWREFLAAALKLEDERRLRRQAREEAK
jgi:hypothetical protein